MTNESRDGRMRAVILVYSTHAAVRAERALGAAGVACRMVPVPRHLSSECGVCIEIDSAISGEAGRLLAAQDIEVAGIHNLQPDGNV